MENTKELSAMLKVITGKSIEDVIDDKYVKGKTDTQISLEVSENIRRNQKDMFKEAIDEISKDSK